MTRLGQVVRVLRRIVKQRYPHTAPSRGAGQGGHTGTVEVDPRTVGAPDLTYAPDPDGAPDPGEVVWTWVPFEENDGRGKDRPVLVIARETSTTVLSVPLTSKDHPDPDRVDIGSGGWDSEERTSYADTGRLLRVHRAGMRREATCVPRDVFAVVVDRLRARNGWR